MASGSPGTSQCATNPTVMVVNVTSPMASSRMGRTGLEELPQGHKPAIGKEERRQEAEEEEARIELHPRKRRHERDAHAAKQVSDQLRPGQPAPNDAQAGDQQEQDQGMFESRHGGTLEPQSRQDTKKTSGAERSTLVLHRGESLMLARISLNN